MRAQSSLLTRSIRFAGAAFLATALAVAAVVSPSPSASPATAAEASGPGPRATLVVVVRYADASGTPRGDAATARAAIFTGATSANAYFKEVSNGASPLVGIKDPAGDVVGPVVIPGASGCAEAVGPAQDAARAQGYDPSLYRHVVVFIANGTTCGGGKAALGGGWSAMDFGAGNQTITHELGHNLGLGHAGALTCPNETTTNGVVTLGGSVPSDGSTNVPTGCSSEEYADPYSTMGHLQTRWYSAPQLASIGWLRPSQVTTAATDGTYTLAPLSQFDAATRTVAVPIAGNRKLWIERRVNYGKFEQYSDPTGQPVSNIPNGVIFHLSNGFSGDRPTLVDMKLNHTAPVNGSTWDRPDAELLPGQTFVLNGISIKLVSIDPNTNAANLQITYPTASTDPATWPAAAVKASTSSVMTNRATGAAETSTTSNDVVATAPTSRSVWNLINVSNGIYRVKNTETQNCLSTVGHGTAVGTAVNLQPCETYLSQKWRILQAPSGGSVFYHISSGLCLAPVGSTPQTQRNASLQACKDIPGMTFDYTVIPTSLWASAPVNTSATYRIQNVAGDLIVKGDNPSLTTAGAGSTFTMVPQSDGSYRVVANNGECMVSGNGGAFFYGCNPAFQDQYIFIKQNPYGGVSFISRQSGRCFSMNSAGTGAVDAQCGSATTGRWTLTQP
ncbi:MAG TPA: RICIN domain-containing protein [Candidatus Lumbricidophila sp.]|nr:RICIN domain-containing protein [Candidatus Lumbricidophila sp.]